jgi:hypothetical protein
LETKKLEDTFAIFNCTANLEIGAPATYDNGLSRVLDLLATPMIVALFKHISRFIPGTLGSLLRLAFLFWLADELGAMDDVSLESLSP